MSRLPSSFSAFPARDAKDRQRGWYLWRITFICTRCHKVRVEWMTGEEAFVRAYYATPICQDCDSDDPATRELPPGPG